MIIIKEDCIGCGKCVEDCISMVLKLKDNQAICTDACLHCGHCIAICPVNAVSMPDYDMGDVQELSEMETQIPIRTLLHAIKARRSIRQYSDWDVEQEKLVNILQAGRYTATAANLQETRFFVVQKELDHFKKIIWEDVAKAVEKGTEDAQRLQKALDLRKEKQIDYLFRNAPVVLLIAEDNPWNAGLAAQNMELAAVSQGLGVMYNGYLVRAIRNGEQVKEWLQLGEKPVTACMLLGYPSVKYCRTAPKKIADITWR